MDDPVGWTATKSDLGLNSTLHIANLLDLKGLDFNDLWPGVNWKVHLPSWEFLNFKQLFIGPQATAKVGIKILQDWQEENESNCNCYEALSNVLNQTWVKSNDVSQ